MTFTKTVWACVFGVWIAGAPLTVVTLILDDPKPDVRLCFVGEDDNGNPMTGCVPAYSKEQP